MFSVNTHSVHHSNGRDEIVHYFSTFGQICDVTRHNVHCGHVFHASRKSRATGKHGNAGTETGTGTGRDAQNGSQYF